jgi:hypothetical protein
LFKWGATPFVDNLPTDNYFYCISVQTGVGKESGTLSNVGFVAVGESADSGVRKLFDGTRKVYLISIGIDFSISFTFLFRFY